MFLDALPEDFHHHIVYEHCREFDDDLGRHRAQFFFRVDYDSDVKLKEMFAQLASDKGKLGLSAPVVPCPMGNVELADANFIKLSLDDL